MLLQDQIELIHKTTPDNKRSIVKALEELSELQVALTQSCTKEELSKAEHYGRVSDKIADVTIQLEAIKHLFTITPQMFEITLQKKIEKMKSKFESV